MVSKNLVNGKKRVKMSQNYSAEFDGADAQFNFYDDFYSYQNLYDLLWRRGVHIPTSAPVVSSFDLVIQRTRII